MQSVRRYVLGLTIALWIVLSPATEAAQRVVWVANNGTDTPGCGSGKLTACRSISFGILNANEGDLVLVRPGRYGDIDNDLQYTTPGDELPNVASRCMVCVDKGVTIASTHGADVTVISPGRPAAGEPRPTEPGITVLIRANGARFGAPGQGFTVYGSNVGLRIHGASDVRLIGNVILDSETTGLQILETTGPVFASQNTVRGGNPGVMVISDQPVTMVDSAATDNRGSGFQFIGFANHWIARNTASGNGGSGFNFEGPGSFTVRGNIASANAAAGFTVFEFGHTVTQNSAIGNRDGFRIPRESPTMKASLYSHNNIVGNAQCGFANQGDRKAVATNNYWGSPSGPGPRPADKGGPGSGCDASFTTTVVVPFLTEQF
jgi:Right handed beta helix region